MSRSNYCCDIDEWWPYIRWRGAVASAMKGKRGQAFFKDLLKALDAMPNKRLITDKLEADGEYCTLGVLGHARNMDMADIDPENSKQVSAEFGIAEALAREVVFENDEWPSIETPEQRWHRMRWWVADQIKSEMVT